MLTRDGDMPHDARALPQSTRAGEAAVTTIEWATPLRLAALDADWRDLLGRAETENIFMHPALLGAAMRSYADDCCALLAWQDAPKSTKTRGRKLAGLWAFALRRAPQSLLPVAVLAAPAMANAYLGTPVIDKECLDGVLDAMMTFVARDKRLPKTVAVDAMSADSATMEALLRTLDARGSKPRLFNQWQRPRLASRADGKAYFEKALSASSRKKLRQHRRRLSERGALQSDIVRDVDGIKRAFEDFLALEAAGWKGRQGTALSSNEQDAAFARTMIADLAARGDVAIHRLTLDNKPVSLQIVLRTGATAFTWKTTYDESLHDFSPGMLLLEDYTTALLADKSIAKTDSCTFDDTSYMAVWTERMAMAQLWFDVRRGGSLTFKLLSALQATYLALRQRAKTLYHRYRLRRPRHLS